jgi:hypothetical protein
LENYFILAVKLCFKFPGKGNSGQRTINLEIPNKCNLCDNPIEQTIDSYLREWEILKINEDEPVEDQLQLFGS